MPVASRRAMLDDIEKQKLSHKLPHSITESAEQRLSFRKEKIELEKKLHKQKQLKNKEIKIELNKIVEPPIQTIENVEIESQENKVEEVEVTKKLDVVEEPKKEKDHIVTKKVTKKPSVKKTRSSSKK